MFVGVVVVGLAIGLLLRGGPADVAEVGAPAPDFTVELLDGGGFSLSDHKANDGRPLLMNLWASWCIPCRAETPELSEFARSHPEIRVIGVAVRDTESQARRFAEEFSPFHDLAFGNPDFEAVYPTLGLPLTFLIDEDGVVIKITYGEVDGERLQEMIES